MTTLPPIQLTLYDNASRRPFNARESLWRVKNAWLTQVETHGAQALAATGDDDECERELARLEKLCNERLATWRQSL